jgi:hypothetical protein
MSAFRPQNQVGLPIGQCLLLDPASPLARIRELQPFHPSYASMRDGSSLESRTLSLAYKHKSEIPRSYHLRNCAIEKPQISTNTSQMALTNRHDLLAIIRRLEKSILRQTPLPTLRWSRREHIPPSEASSNALKA